MKRKLERYLSEKLKISTRVIQRTFRQDFVNEQKSHNTGLLFEMKMRL